MREGAKKRLIGAVVIVALAVIFVPMLFEPESLDNLPPVQQAIPRPPAFPAGKQEVFLGPQDSGVSGPAEAAPTVSQPLPLPPVGELAPVPIAAPSGAPGRPNVGGGAGPVQTPGQTPGQTAAQPAVAPTKPAAGPPPRASAEPAADKATKASAKGPAAAEPAPPRGGNGGQSSWVIQVSSGASREAADAQRDKLRAGGFAAFVEEAQVNGKATYRVQVGPELDRARADQTAARLREKQKVNTLIKSYP